VWLQERLDCDIIRSRASVAHGVCAKAAQMYKNGNGSIKETRINIEERNDDSSSEDSDEP